MLRKKQILTQTNNFIELKETSQQILQNRNDKVTVQYIQEQQQLIQKPEKSITINNVRTQDDLEVENVEYLEENPTADELIDKPSTERQNFEDTFYPNAIHCLLDLYKDKYESLLTMDEGDLNVVEVWKDIAKDMQESYFEFNEQQVRQKYILLKQQYFGLHFKEDIENFDYFEQLHDIYKDPSKENLIKGLVVDENSSTYYKDDILLNHVQLETNNDHLEDFKSEVIVHKEHEFIDIVEKELHVIEDGVQVAESNKHKDNGQQSIKIVQQNTVKVENLENQTDLKGNNTDEETTIEGPSLKKRKIYESCGNIRIPHASLKEPTFTENKDITLCQYNEHQERRHREKMNILEKSLKLQENAIEQHKLLLQELIKRLPS